MNNDIVVPKDVMIDIETLGTDADAVILSVGAVAFDKTGIKKEFYAELDVAQQLNRRKVTLDTLKWWTEQGNIPWDGNIPIYDAIEDLSQFFINFSEDVNVWANGPHFDCTILDHAFKSFGWKTPWKYNKVRDYRTLAKCFPELPHPPEPQIFIPHNALDDAKKQAFHLIDLLNYIQYWDKR